jgi:hypothetical protein
MNKLKTLIVTAIIITLNSCYVQHQHSYTQEHISSHYRNNFSRRDNGGCGWHRQQPNRVENRNYMREW